MLKKELPFDDFGSSIVFLLNLVGSVFYEERLLYYEFPKKKTCLVLNALFMRFLFFYEKLCVLKLTVKAKLSNFKCFPYEIF